MRSSTPSPTVSIVGVDHAYDNEQVLHDVNLDIRSGESVALLGPSGCGKTTLLRLIAGLDFATRGEVSIGETVVSSTSIRVLPEDRRVGMVFQDWALFPHLDVRSNVAYGIARPDRKGPRVDNALELVGLAGLGDRMPNTLSGGQQQRVALARALAPEPAVLLLDEPFSNLDTSLRLEVRTEVHRLLHELGITTIFVTHDQEEAFVLGDRVAIMRDGRVVQVDTPHGVYTRPSDRQVAEFVGSGSLIAATARDGHAGSPCGRVPVSIANGQVDLLFRPEQLDVIEGDTAIVDLIEYHGHDSMVYLRCDDSSLRVRCAPQPDFQRGDRVGVRFNGTQVLAFPA